MNSKSKKEIRKENRLKTMFNDGYCFYHSLNRKTETVKPKGLVKFLERNDLVILSSIYDAIKDNKLDIVIFYDLYSKLRSSTKEFDFRPTGYVKDFGITYEVAARLIKILGDLGCKVDKNEILYFDREDYENYLKYSDIMSECKNLRKLAIDFESSPKPRYFKSKLDFVVKDEKLIIEKYKETNLKRDNKGERDIQALLDKFGIEYERQAIFKINDKQYLADFYIPKNNVIIEVDGEYHNDEDQQLKDFNRDKDFAQRGILTLRLQASSIDDLANSEFLIKNILSTVNIDLPNENCFSERLVIKEKLENERLKNKTSKYKCITFVLDRSTWVMCSSYYATKFFLDNDVSCITTSSLANISFDLKDKGYDIYVMYRSKEIKIEEGMKLSDGTVLNRDVSLLDIIKSDFFFNEIK